MAFSPVRVVAEFLVIFGEHGAYCFVLITVFFPL